MGHHKCENWAIRGVGRVWAAFPIHFGLLGLLTLSLDSQRRMSLLHVTVCMGTILFCCGGFAVSHAHPEAQLRQPLLPAHPVLQEDGSGAAPLPSNLP